MPVIDPFLALYKYREVFFRTGLSEVRSRYAGSVLGLLWLMLAPLLLMSIYAAIYLVVFQVRPADMSPTQYVLYVLSGLIPFLGFSDALASGSSSLTMNRAILLSTVFPAELVPLRAVLVSQAPTLAGLGLCVIAATVAGHASWAMLALPLIWALLVTFVAGIVWVLALVSLLIRDVQQALGFVNMILLIACPIGYTLAMVPAQFRPLFQLNPLSHFIEAMHGAVVFGQWPGVSAWAVMLSLSLLSCAAGFRIFQRAKRVLFDYA